MSATCFFLAMVCLVVGGFFVYSAMKFFEDPPPTWTPPQPAEDTEP